MPKSKRIKFADAIIVLCVVMGILITGAVLYEYHRLDTVLPSSSLTVLFGFWGGELLIIALRQIFGSDVVSQKHKPKQEEEMFP